MSDELLERIAEHLPRLLTAVETRNLDDVLASYSAAQKALGMPGGHALTVALAETLLLERRRHREQLVRLNGEATRYASAYLDAKRKVGELRELLDAKAAASPKVQRSA